MVEIECQLTYFHVEGSGDWASRRGGEVTYQYNPFHVAQEVLYASPGILEIGAQIQCLPNGQGEQEVRSDAKTLARPCEIPVGNVVVKEIVALDDNCSRARVELAHV